MCMIAYRPISLKSGRGANIPGSVIDTAMRRHADGFGVAYRDDSGELVTEKFGPREDKRFRKALKRIDREGTREYVAHFRFATHGPKDAAHAHPYEYQHPVDGRVLVFHNGVIDIATTPIESDTEVFTKLVLADLPSRWWERPSLMYLVTEAIGWSKLVIMTREGTYCLHEKRGDWDGGIWYSSDHKPTYGAYKGPAVGTAAYMGMYGVQTTRSQGASAYAATTTGKGSTWVPPTKVTERAATRDVMMLGSGIADRDVDDHTFRHGGHKLSSIVTIDRTKDGDYQQGVICDECYTIGDLYVIDGGIYIDMAHKGEVDPREEEVICDA